MPGFPIYGIMPFRGESSLAEASLDKWFERSIALGFFSDAVIVSRDFMVRSPQAETELGAGSNTAESIDIPGPFLPCASPIYTCTIRELMRLHVLISSRHFKRRNISSATT